MSSLPKHRTVADVMTEKVHVAGPQTPFKLLVRLIEENRISAVPIVDVQGVPLGIVSEADLLHKERRRDLERGINLLHPRRRSRERAKAEGLVAEDLMSAPPLTVSAKTQVAEAAQLMQERNVRRLVVVDERGRIAGIVSRSDLLQVFLRGDEDLKDEIVEKVIPSLMLTPEEPVEVDVRYNVVTLLGEVDRRSDAKIMARLAREVDGVVDVVDRLRYRWDDTVPVPVGPAVESDSLRPY
jgi:CBS domain-containing protein